MITNLALLARNIPDLFRRLPAVTSVGYRMPHKRYFFAGISFSAALHAAVLFGIRPPVVPPHEVAPVDLREICGDPFPLDLEELKKPEPEPSKDKKDEKTDPANTGEELAHFAEPISNPMNGDITITVEKINLKLPDLDRKDGWDVPKSPIKERKSYGDGTILNEKDLDVRPVVTSRASPRYPYELKRSLITGSALLRFVVDSRGNVSDIEVVRSDHPEFGKSAAEALLKWKFRAGLKGGRRVNTRMEMPMIFSVNSDT